MANGWGGRRPGAGAPKGNNNAVKHGEYCRPIMNIDLSSMVELRRLNIAICAYRFSLPEYREVTPFERRECYRLDGMSGWIIDKLIQREKKISRDSLKQAKAELKKAKVKCLEAKARLIATKAAKKQSRL